MNFTLTEHMLNLSGLKMFASTNYFLSLCMNVKFRQ